ncbi:MAG: thioredoxin family protein [Candidatus Omnitrophota bacterium]
MKIEILGTGCPKCQKLYENVQEAVDQSEVNAEIVKVTGINKIMEYGVMITPALVIAGQVKAAGKIPSVDEIKNWISQ